MRDLIDAAPHVDPDEHHTLAPADELDGKAEDLGTLTQRRSPRRRRFGCSVRWRPSGRCEALMRASPPPTEPASALRIRPR